MSARGHKPRTSDRRDIANIVGGVSGFQYVGVGDYSKRASSDPADIVLTELSIARWITSAFDGASIADISALRTELREGIA